MKKLLATLILCIAGTSASATSLPGQTYAINSSTEYCMGLVVGGLASNKVASMDRAELWKAWSYLIRSGALHETRADPDFAAGKAQFQNVADAAAASSALEDAGDDCGLGRSGRQITGW